MDEVNWRAKGFTGKFRRSRSLPGGGCIRADQRRPPRPEGRVPDFFAVREEVRTRSRLAASRPSTARSVERVRVAFTAPSERLRVPEPCVEEDQSLPPAEVP